MNRSEFVRLCGLLGISLPFQPLLSSCTSAAVPSGPPLGSSETVIIIGAGAAGMSAGHLLSQRGVDFRILEASSTYGGRMKQNTSFSNFPIPLGAEWIHVSPSILTDIVNDSGVQINTQTTIYDIQEDTAGFYDGSTLTVGTLATIFGPENEDSKFIGSSWLDFFETYVLPSVESKITYNTPISAIDYSEDLVQVTTASGEEFSANRVIVTVPLKLLKDNFVSFSPPLPSAKQNAIADAVVWGGFKAFFKFSSLFYPTFLVFNDSETPVGQRLYYDAAYAQDTQDHILGLFSVGAQAMPYQNLSGDALRDYILNELDEVFDGAASDNYIDHIVQNWNDEPFARAAYLDDDASVSISRAMSTSVNGKLYFAGTSYTQEDDWSSVHTAARSARDVVAELFGG